MNAQEKNYAPRLNNWFSSKIEYKGLGTATFTDPNGVIQGQTYVRYNECDSCEITMTVKKVIVNGIEANDPSWALPAFFQGREPNSVNTHSKGLPVVVRNPCLLLEVTTVDGKFVAVDLGTAYHLSGNLLARHPAVTFNPLQAYFETHSPTLGQYFVAPLSNFLNNSGWFTEFHPAIAYHPLRIQASFPIPNDLPDEQKRIAYMQQRAGQSVVGFDFFDEPAFIEPLPDYKLREKRLRKAKRKCLITAIMVGTVGQKEITLLNWNSLGFRELLPLLSLATGIYVGSPWLELRDSDGRLVRRIHNNIASSTYKKGLSALGSAVDRGGLGYFLSVAQSSAEFGKAYLRATLSQLVMGGYFDFDGNIEDRMSHLFRALDCLCNEHIPRKRVSVLSPQNSKILKQKTKEFIKAVKDLKKNTLAVTTDDEAKLEAEELDRIAEAFASVKSSPLGFSKRIELLLQKFGLEDALILNEHYDLNPGPDNTKRWADVVVYYRNKVMHSAWFDWESKRVNFRELTAITFHMHDILVRIVLILLEYDGKYVPSIFQLRGLSKEITWVQKATSSAKDLGYE